MKTCKKAFAFLAVMLCAVPVLFFAGCSDTKPTPLAPVLSFQSTDPDDEYSESVYLCIETYRQGANHFDYEIEIWIDGLFHAAPSGSVTTITFAYSFCVDISAFKTVGEYEFRVRTKHSSSNKWSNVAVTRARVVDGGEVSSAVGYWADLNIDEETGAVTITYYTVVG